MTKFARYEVGGNISYGIVEGDNVKDISTAPYETYTETGSTHSLSDVKLLAPVMPGKIIAIGRNYVSHLDHSASLVGGDMELPKVPEPFFKTPSSVIGPNDPIILPKEVAEEGVLVEEEAELTLVIGKRCRRANQANAFDYVLGVTCGNDVSARDWQKDDLSWWRAKSSDTFSPIGPYIVTGLDADNLLLTGRINGEVIQQSSTTDLAHNCRRIIEFVSAVVTLEPGDVIMTGTPGSPGQIKPGDVVEVELEGVGILSNPVQAE
ncbi:MAG: hypothetical protein BZY79_02035 [SAR202 cluster bacterium Casp-Chloro-G4]|nr:fumarylacetoacetate hydrolase family protein [Chloroflexota bacterium]MDA1227190.1 fumarylacetoacetate hydrolase family protein [Chloroflexota bacterium]PKB61757.1 MAG: hypothetical protein BZY79_02035 [SAR202 cluster bacterium Casp-Chloro-G4]